MRSNVLTVDIGGTRIKWAVIPADCKPHAAPYNVESMRTLGWLNSSLSSLVDSSNWAGITHPRRNLAPFDRVGVAICSPLGLASEVRREDLIGDGVPSNLRERMALHLRRPIKLFNDAEAWMRGALRTSREEVRFPCMALILGTGVGFAYANHQQDVCGVEFDKKIKAACLAASAGMDSVEAHQIHDVLGIRFFRYVEAQRKAWSYLEVRKQVTSRLLALIQDLQNSGFEPKTLFIGGGNAEYVSIRAAKDKFRHLNIIALRKPELSFTPDLIPLAGTM
jgi:hypothetical protein